LFLERHFDEAIRLIHNRLTEYRTCPTSKGYLIHSFCSLPKSMPEILSGREPLLNKCWVR
jgi:hypothetical protein